MAEALVTTASLNEYLANIDMTVLDNRKVLAGLQSLNANILETIVYYLVIGKVNISSLYTMDINNLSIKQLLTSLDSSETIVNRRIFYKDKIKALPGYSVFKTTVKASTALRLSNMALSTDELMTTVVIDPLGATSKYTNFVQVMNTYDSIVFSLDGQTKINAVTTASNLLKNTYGLTNITGMTELLLETITEYGLITTSTTYKNTLGNSTILGFTARNLHSFLTQRNLIQNMSSVTLKMAINDALDTPKNGVYTLKQFLTSNDFKYTTIFNLDYATRGTVFIDQLALIAFIRKELVCNIYGLNYFTQTEINTEVNIYNAIISYLTKLNELMTFIREQCKLLITE